MPAHHLDLITTLIGGATEHHLVEVERQSKVLTEALASILNRVMTIQDRSARTRALLSGYFDSLVDLGPLARLLMHDRAFASTPHWERAQRQRRCFIRLLGGQPDDLDAATAAGIALQLIEQAVALENRGRQIVRHEALDAASRALDVGPRRRRRLRSHRVAS